MHNIQKIIESRFCGDIRFAIVSARENDFSSTLTKLGLKANPDSLNEYDSISAFNILTTLLWKDMAYEHECMSRNDAETFAKRILNNYSEPDCRYFSNGNWTESKSWNPMTDSTFDSGIIIENKRKNWVCIWFQDED